MSNFEGVRMAHWQAVICFSVYPPPRPPVVLHTKIEHCPVVSVKEKAPNRILLLIGFPSDSITLRTSIICENLNYFEVSFEASLVNENGMLGPLCLPFSCLSLLFMLFFRYLLFLSLHFFSWLTKEGYSVAGQITHLMPRDFG